MPYCPKCGNEVAENMTFCPRCGASLKVETQAPPAQAAPTQPQVRNEKAEKGEKQEKQKQEPEKGEKHEKGEFGYIGFLIAGLVVIIIGVVTFMRVTGWLAGTWEGPLILLIVGFAIIVVGIYVAMIARKRNPPAS